MEQTSMTALVSAFARAYHAKNDPAPVFRLQHMADVDAADVTVIGDASFDMQMGRNAHVGRCIGVAWGNHSAAQLCEAGADFVACSPTEL